MKRVTILLCSAFVFIYAFMPLHEYKASIYGSIDPPEGAKKVWAISATDSFSTIPLTGKFSVDVKPGTWRLIIEAVSPYKSTVVENILVEEGKSADAGVIKLTE